MGERSRARVVAVACAGSCSLRFGLRRTPRSSTVFARGASGGSCACVRTGGGVEEREKGGGVGGEEERTREGVRGGVPPSSSYKRGTSE